MISIEYGGIQCLIQLPIIIDYIMIFVDILELYIWTVVVQFQFGCTILITYHLIYVVCVLISPPLELLWLHSWESSLWLSLRWRHNERDSVSNHQPHDCLLKRLFRRRSKKTSKLRVTGLCTGNSPVPGEFPAQMASNAENVSIWWRHHVWRIGDAAHAVGR